MLTTGSVLGNRWVIGKFVGEGACAKVYSVVDNKSPVEYETVAKVIALPKSTGKKDKEQERICNTLYYEYNLYTGLLNGFPFCPKTPLKFYGEDNGFRYLVMERLEADLVGYAARNTITPAVLAEFGLQILDGLQWLHAKNFIFVDVKPENFMMKQNKVHFVDFGLVERYVASPAVNARAPGTRAAFAGTPTFCSLSVHKGGIPTGADDVEAMAYVLLSLLSNGKMPWSAAKSDQDCIRSKETCDIMQLATERRCQELGQIVVNTRRLQSGQAVDYAGCRQLLTQMKNRKDASVASSTGKRVLSPSPKKVSRTSAAAASSSSSSSSNAKAAVVAEEGDVEIVSPPKKKRATATKAATAAEDPVVEPAPAAKRGRGAATTTTAAASAATVPATPSLVSRRKATTASAAPVSAPTIDLTEDEPPTTGRVSEGPFSAAPIRASRNVLASPVMSPAPSTTSRRRHSASAVADNDDNDAPFSSSATSATATATAVASVTKSKKSAAAASIDNEGVMNWCLEAIDGPHAGSSYTVGPSNDKKAKVLLKNVGRGDYCELSLSDDEYLSECHLLVKISKQKLYVQDNESTNGSKVNGDKLLPNKWVEVSEGNTISIGETEFS